MKITQNVDPQELAKFASFSSRWWDIEGDLKTLHKINPLRLSFILEKTDLSQKTTVDVGCGGGILTEALAQSGAIVTGVDLSKELIEVAKLHQKESKTSIEYLNQSVESLAAERPEHFDVLTCMELLEHVPDPAALVRACAKLVRRDGHLFFSTLNRNPKSYLFAILGAEYVLKLLPKNTHDYAKFIRPSELSAWSREAGLSPQDLRGIRYHLLTKEYQLTKDTSVNYLFYAKKIS